MNEITHAPGLEGYSRLLSAAQSVADESVRRLLELVDRFPGALPADVLAQLMEEDPCQPTAELTPVGTESIPLEQVG